MQINSNGSKDKKYLVKAIGMQYYIRVYQMQLDINERYKKCK
jgi:hypothetical protein